MSYFNFYGARQGLNFLEHKYLIQSQALFSKQMHLEAIVNNSSFDEYLDKIKDLPRKEFLILGRSNVGKSSLLNALTQRNAAETSNYPGKTRDLYFYNFRGTQVFIVDAPGYGFAKGDKKDLKSWGVMMQRYLKYSQNVRYIFTLIDAEHGFKQVDRMVLDMLEKMKKPHSICFTKVDKLTKEGRTNLELQAQEVQQKYFTVDKVMHLTSARTFTGIDQIRQQICYMIE